MHTLGPLVSQLKLMNPAWNADTSSTEEFARRLEIAQSNLATWVEEPGWWYHVLGIAISSCLDGRS